MEFNFYTSARLDGLKRRVEILGEKFIEEYDESSEGGLEYRSVKYDGSLSRMGQLFLFPSLIGDSVITKMTEKFRKTKSKPNTPTPLSPSLSEAHHTLMMHVSCPFVMKIILMIKFEKSRITSIPRLRLELSSSTITR